LKQLRATARKEAFIDFVTGGRNRRKTGREDLSLDGGSYNILPCRHTQKEEKKKKNRTSKRNGKEMRSTIKGGEKEPGD